MLGAAKGLVAAAFVVAGIEKFLPLDMQKTEVVEEQAKTSRALAWSLEHHPADRIWRTQPVQTMVAEVRRYGLDGSEPEDPPAAQAEPAPDSATVKSPEAPAQGSARDSAAPVKTARRGSSLVLPPVPGAAPEERQALEEIDQELRDLGLGESGAK